MATHGQGTSAHTQGLLCTLPARHSSAVYHPEIYPALSNPSTVPEDFTRISTLWAWITRVHTHTHAHHHPRGDCRTDGLVSSQYSRLNLQVMHPDRWRKYILYISHMTILFSGQLLFTPLKPLSVFLTKIPKPPS